MAHKQTHPRSHADFRHRSQIPLPAVDEVEQRLMDVLSPSLLAPRQLERRDPRQPDRLIRMRQRLLTLPVMVAILVSLVWRRVPSIAEVQKVLTREGLLGMAPLQVSPQAITKRLDVLPAAVMGQLFAEVCTRVQAQSPPPLPHPRWAPVRERFPVLAIGDGSTLEALRKKTASLQARTGLVLAGKIMVLVDAFSHRPLWQLYTEDAAANDKRFAAEILAALPVGGLLVCDLGFFSFLWFDDFTDQKKFFVTRMREKTAYRTVQLLSQGLAYRDEIIQVGQYRSNPCVHPLRMVSVLWQGTWYRYLTNVLDPQALSPRQVCELYRRRWRIEDAFALTKRLLDLAYVWTGSSNAVQLQIYATLMFYAVLLTICQQVAQVLGEPLERISVEMVFRAFYHYSRAVQRGESNDLVSFLAEHAKLLGIVKRQRKAHRERQQLEAIIWGDP
jgi:Transposase DDE domain